MRQKVLLVDDDDFARQFARIVLARAGYEVVEAIDVTSALTLAAQLRPMAVVTDWNLPDGTGGALVRRLHEQMHGLPVILITGDGAVGAGESLETTQEFAAVLHKPYSPKVLESAMRALENP